MTNFFSFFFILHSTFWKQLSREKLNNNDIKGLDEKMYVEMTELEKCRTQEEYEMLYDTMLDSDAQKTDVIYFTTELRYVVDCVTIYYRL